VVAPPGAWLLAGRRASVAQAAEPAITLELIVDPVSMPADGASRARVVVRASDETGQPVADGTVVQLRTSQGSLEPASVRTQGGQAEAWLTAGESAGWARIRARAGQARARTSVRLIALPHPGARLLRRAPASDQVGPFDPSDAPERDRHPVVAGLDDRLEGAGGGVRASFEAEGLSVQHEQAREHALLFEVLGVHIGDETLFDAQATPPGRFGARENQASRLLAEGLVERYVVRDGGVEQLFVLEQSPEITGSLRIEGRFQTELRPWLLSLEEGIVFLDAEGNPALAYGRAMARDALGRKHPVQMALAGEALTLTLPAEWLEGAMYPVTVDPLIGDPQEVADGATELKSLDVAYNPQAGEWLAVWADDRNGTWDIFGQQLDEAGDLEGSAFQISDAGASGDQLRPRVAVAAGGSYMVV
jgi:hypothetical protein